MSDESYSPHTVQTVRHSSENYYVFIFISYQVEFLNF
jgi:hypothetical protein